MVWKLDITARLIAHTTNMHLKKILISLIYLLLGIASTMAHTEQRIEILNLPDLNNWEEKIFSNNTHYETISIDNKVALKASSNNAASVLYKKITVDLNKTPYLNWSWKINKTLRNTVETTKAGDDYAARVYVVISGGVLFWKSRALNYVWSSNQLKGNNWPNAYTSNATMIAAQSGDTLAGQWVREKRNVLEDIQQILGTNDTQIDAVAIMTDTDNSHQSTIAYYGNIYFSSQ
ncbi:MAG: DUF3047 domain-containing protein [Gammaproteobacteria bacterium]|nr:DUF3047 domain-containing protein [Gammaproteobacteria bacterium]